jgi:hypothetical protein
VLGQVNHPRRIHGTHLRHIHVHRGQISLFLAVDAWVRLYSLAASNLWELKKINNSYQ